jgi:hypothetical protein
MTSWIFYFDADVYGTLLGHSHGQDKCSIIIRKARETFIDEEGERIVAPFLLHCFRKVGRSSDPANLTNEHGAEVEE